MKSYHLNILAAAIAMLLCALPSQAQSSDAGSRPVATAQKAAKGNVRIAGRVIDASLDGVGGAMVKVMSGKKVEAYALTREDGTYELSVPEALMINTAVEISSMGFASLTLLLSELEKNPVVELKREVSQLDEFTVKGKSVKVKRPNWLANAVVYEANLRQASADRNLAGLAKRLPQLQEIGVNVLCLMPIHPISEKNRQGSLGSPYAVADYKAVNPEFGTLDQFRTFIKLAHLHGMKVLLDETCGFSGMDHPWVSEHPEYYARTDSGEMIVAPGHPDAYKFDYANPEWRREMVEALTFWVKETGIDGFRFAGADALPVDFWLRARKTVQQVKPVVFIAEASDPELLKEAFDADYGWPMTDAFTALAATQGVNAYAYTHNLPLPETDAQAIPEIIRAQRGVYPKGSLHLNMTSNHGLNASEGTEYDRYGPAARAFAVLSYLLPGVPLIYNGQEVGNERAFSPTDADTVPDFTHNLPMQQLYTKLGQLRKNHRVLWQASGKEPKFKVIETTSPSILAFERAHDNDRILVFVNLSNYSQELNFPGKEPDVANMRNHFYRFARELPAELGPWEFHVYRPFKSIPRVVYHSRFKDGIDLDQFMSDQIYRFQVLQDVGRVIDAYQENERRRQLEWEDE